MRVRRHERTSLDTRPGAVPVMRGPRGRVSGVRARTWPAVAWLTAALIGAPLAAGCSAPPPPRDRRASNEDTQPEQARPSASTGPELPIAPDNGFGTAVTWRSLDDGLAEAQRTGRPLMLVVHTSWCSRCKALKPQFAQRDVAQLAERFVMVNIDQDTDERVMRYGPDGTYIPRVMFFDPSGELDPTIDNDRSPKFKYFYTSSLDLVKSMHEAIERHGKPT